MRRTQFRPRAASSGILRLQNVGRHEFRPRAGHARRLRPRLLIAGAVILAAAVAWVAVQLLRPVPPMTLTASVTTVRALPGAAPRPDWPGGAEAAVGLPGIGLLGTHGGGPVPIASLAKIMTAYVVLRDHPLPVGGSGPVITVTAADAATYASDQRQGQSVVKVEPEEKLTERQALEAMPIPSGYVSHITLDASQAVPAPSVSWLLTRL
jgi:serine-type D-Ala-D-Ala carboxypeptidase (penicillin-binding protein 5/6)